MAKCSLFKTSRINSVQKVGRKISNLWKRRSCLFSQIKLGLIFYRFWWHKKRNKFRLALRRKFSFLLEHRKSTCLARGFQAIFWQEKKTCKRLKFDDSKTVLQNYTSIFGIEQVVKLDLKSQIGTCKFVVESKGMANVEKSL